MNLHSSSSTDTATRRLATVAFVLAVALIYAGVRSTTGLVWNDGATLSFTLDSAPGPGGLDFPAALGILESVFASAASGGYRPLSLFFANLSVRYFLDPIKNYTPRLLTNVLFAPDLENDFYRGRARSGVPFMREIYVTYTLYKVLKVDS